MLGTAVHKGGQITRFPCRTANVELRVPSISLKPPKKRLHSAEIRRRFLREEQGNVSGASFGVGTY
jgi:hypothetical protein